MTTTADGRGGKLMTNMMTELEYCRMDLDNYIGGLEISKSALPESWTEDDERILNLMMRIKDILCNIKVSKKDGKENA